MKTGIFFAAIISSTFLSACVSESSAESPAPTIPFSIIVSGQYTASGVVENRRIEVFRDQASLNANLAIYVQFVQEHTVDFSTSQVVLTNVGERGNPSYGVKTERIFESQDHITVQTTLSKPGNSCASLPVLAYPFEFIEIQSTKEIIFEQKLVVVDCPELN